MSETEVKGPEADDMGLDGIVGVIAGEAEPGEDDIATPPEDTGGEEPSAVDEPQAAEDEPAPAEAASEAVKKEETPAEEQPAEAKPAAPEHTLSPDAELKEGDEHARERDGILGDLREERGTNRELREANQALLTRLEALDAVNADRIKSEAPAPDPLGLGDRPDDDLLTVGDQRRLKAYLETRDAERTEASARATFEDRVIEGSERLTRETSADVDGQPNPLKAAGLDYTTVLTEGKATLTPGAHYDIIHSDKPADDAYRLHIQCSRVLRRRYEEYVRTQGAPVATPTAPPPPGPPQGTNTAPTADPPSQDDILSGEVDPLVSVVMGEGEPPG